jgi:hypothetical protein
MKRSDRRLALRFSIKTPLYVRTWRSGEAERRLESVNVSETGVYFETDAPPPEGAVIHIRLEMPSAITGSVGIEWHCIGKVVRVNRTAGVSRSGVGVQFEYYEAVAGAKFQAAQSACA